MAEILLKYPRSMEMVGFSKDSERTKFEYRRCVQVRVAIGTRFETAHTLRQKLCSSSALGFR